MDVTEVEIKVNGEIIFGLYSDNNMLVKDDPDCLAIARALLAEGNETLSAFCESPRATGQS